jgi:hypothetical protein
VRALKRVVFPQLGLPIKAIMGLTIGQYLGKNELLELNFLI